MLVKFARQLYHSLRICSSKLNFYKVEINTDLLKIKKKKKKKDWGKGLEKGEEINSFVLNQRGK